MTSTHNLYTLVSSHVNVLPFFLIYIFDTNFKCDLIQMGNTPKIRSDCMGFTHDLQICNTVD